MSFHIAVVPLVYLILHRDARPEKHLGSFPGWGNGADLSSSTQSWHSVPALIKSYRAGKKNEFLSGKTSWQTHTTLRAFSLPLHLKVNLYAPLETNSVESGAEGTCSLLPPPFSINVSH